MKKFLSILLLLILVVGSHAQSGSAPGSAGVSPARQTNYWSLAHPNWPPLPYLPGTNLPVKAYFVGTSTVNLLIDDSHFVYPTNTVELSTNLNQRPSRILQRTEPRISIRSTNAEDIESVRRFLPSFERMFPGSTRPDRLPKELLTTNNVPETPAFFPTNRPPRRMTPEEAREFKRLHSSSFLPFLFPLLAGRRRKFALCYLLSAVSILTARAQLFDVSTYYCYARPLACPGNDGSHLIGTNGLAMNYYPDSSQVEWRTNNPPRLYVAYYQSPNMFQLQMPISLDYAADFGVAAVFPDSCQFHTNNWPAVEVNFFGLFNNNTAFDVTNIMWMPASDIAIEFTYRAFAHSSSTPPAELLITADEYGPAGTMLLVPSVRRLANPPRTSLWFNAPQAFNMQINQTTDLLSWSSLTNFPMPAGGSAYFEIDDATNQPDALFFSISTTNTYVAP